MNITLRVWRQRNQTQQGRMETYAVEGVSPDMSFLELLDLVKDNEFILGANWDLKMAFAGFMDDDSDDEDRPEYNMLLQQ